MSVPLRALRKPGDPPVTPLPDTDPGPPEPTEYFAYGSNMATARIQKRIPSAKPMGLAILSGHELRFHKRSKDNSAKCDAFATGNDDDAVVGVLFRFDPAERRALDAAEGAGKGYDARMVTVLNSRGRRRKVLTYLASPSAIDNTQKPYTWYKNHVLVGAREHNLPADYVAERIEAVEALEDPDTTRDRKERTTHAAIDAGPQWSPALVPTSGPLKGR
ncbi:gamma-glutamylcyclotransferase [Brevundimonas diminuta]|uniref:gamma-glutamylcyclotransferase family protein n=1 Tax=Brevundimonas diminuta TaxID=293 RepID=UPI0020973A37|nr:gamma-glutamylcyclotransferase family protein [Brevundimonas diminuta]MCO8030813.1 gamma-glutamylcyclotransferase [Brevundimonas diminuta]